MQSERCMMMHDVTMMRKLKEQQILILGVFFGSRYKMIEGLWMKPLGDLCEYHMM
jgi:hypothetical protein